MSDSATVAFIRARLGGPGKQYDFTTREAQATLDKICKGLFNPATNAEVFAVGEVFGEVATAATEVLGRALDAKKAYFSAEASGDQVAMNEAKAQFEALTKQYKEMGPTLQNLNWILQELK